MPRSPSWPLEQNRFTPAAAVRPSLRFAPWRCERRVLFILTAPLLKSGPWTGPYLFSYISPRAKPC